MAAARVRALGWPIAATAAALLATACIPIREARPLSQVFFCKEPAEQAWRVPAGVTQPTIDVLGAQGGSALDGHGSSWPGGDGGRATATIATTPGETLRFYVGCKGGNNAGVNPGAGGAGYLHGGSGGKAAPWIDAIGGGGGGGISVVFRGAATPVIGAGSGGGAAFGAPGGAGGGIAGEDGGAPAGAPERTGRGGGSPGNGAGAGPGPGGGGGGTGFGPPGTVFQTGVQVGHGFIVVRVTA